ncbi:unnamed protein product [Cyclocybe aegerita]|uniref:EamA domain-containing protein n=1 Tax=Cyclocybe aegerita TaxID=1973307 RepID=A0A8S0W888_CYCAE|nr:unnamed protein product [Cyclocybe aegerita]
MEPLHRRESSLSRPKTPVPDRQNYAKGIVLLLVVVLLWTLSNYVTQGMYEGGYNKPFLVTYMNTVSFSFYLLPFLLRRWLGRTEILSTKPFGRGTQAEYQPLALEDDIEESSSPIARLDASLDHPSRIHARENSLPLTDRETADLAFTFCMIWFIANWTVNASLGFTSVASATVLSSTSGFFTLGIGHLFRIEKFTMMKIGAVVTSFIGVAFVSFSDSEGSKPAIQPGETYFDSRAMIGDFFALISALFYAIYVTLLKVRIKSESRIDMQLFFGFVGLFNLLTCWWIGVLLHLTGGEVFELPPTRHALYAILINMAITLSSDYLYVLAMLKTTPLVVTIGLSLTIPCAVIGDFLLKRPAKGAVILGALLVLGSFVAIGWEDAHEEEAETTSTEVQGL